MAIENILAEIDAEITRLKRARALLATLETAATKAGRKTKSATAKAKPGRKQKRVLSPEARKKIADAQRRRWAKQRAKAKA